MATARQHRVEGVALDEFRILALTACPTCRKGPGNPCHKGDHLAGGGADVAFLHGARLNRMWGMIGLVKPFKVNRFYVLLSPDGAWAEIMVNSSWGDKHKLYSKKAGRLRVRKKGR